MTTGIVFDRERAEQAVQAWGLWPTTKRPENRLAQQWWLGVMERVLDAVNAHDWSSEVYPDDRYTEIAEKAVAHQVKQARENRFVMTLCELSEVDKELSDPFDCGVYSRMTSPVVELCRKGLSGGPYEDPEKTAVYQERHEQVTRLLRLGSVTEAYLTAAADDVARAWCVALVEQWQDANPENDEE